MDWIPAFYFDRAGLLETARRRAREFREAEPFPHLVMEDFLPADVAGRLVEEFPAVDAIDWSYWGPGRTTGVPHRRFDKLGQSSDDCFGPFTRHFMAQLNSDGFLHFLSELTGVERLVVDPSYNQCGLHSTGRGGRLMLHTDANRHPHSGDRLHQILNLILFLNPDWEEEYGGHLELWSRDRTCGKRILPRANTAVLFETGTRSLHGHPAPLTCPEGRRRNSLAVYYYTLDRPVGEDYEGMQRSVYWAPSSDEDRSVARGGVARAVEMIARLHGASATLSPRALPVELPGLEAERAPEIFLRLLDWSRLDPAVREGLIRRLRSLVPGELDGDPAAFLERYAPFGWIARTRDAEPGDPESWPVLFERSEGTIHLPLPDSGGLLFCGYVDQLLQAIGTD